MKTIRKFTCLLCFLLSVIVFTGCKDNDPNDDRIDDCAIHPEHLKVRIQDKNGNNLLDITQLDNVIFDVEADVTDKYGTKHYDKPYKFTLDDLYKEELPEEMGYASTLIPFLDADSETTFHFRLFDVLVDGTQYRTATYEYDFTLYIGNDWTRTYHVVYESYSKDNPLREKYGNYRWIVDGVVAPDNNFTVIM